MKINTWKEMKQLKIEVAEVKNYKDYFVVVSDNARTVWNKEKTESITFRDVIDGNHRLAKSFENNEKPEIWIVNESLLMDNGFYGEREEESQEKFQNFVKENGKRYTGKIEVVTV